jgi:hypothetical protein
MANYRLLGGLGAYFWETQFESPLVFGDVGVPP